MFGTVIAVLVLLLALVGVGIAVPALFWLSVLALGGVLLAGAVVVSIVAARGEDEDDGAQAHAGPRLRLVGPPSAAENSPENSPETSPAQRVAEERRAA